MSRSSLAAVGLSERCSKLDPDVGGRLSRCCTAVSFCQPPCSLTWQETLPVRGQHSGPALNKRIQELQTTSDLIHVRLTLCHRHSLSSLIHQFALLRIGWLVEAGIIVDVNCLLAGVIQVRAHQVGLPGFRTGTQRFLFFTQAVLRGAGESFQKN